MTRSRILNSLLALALLLILCAPALAQMRVKPPDFTVPYQHPATTTPWPRPVVMEFVDVAVLLVALSLAAFFAIKLRSRAWVIALTLFSLAYFGFYRQGCICSIGAIQNVTLAFSDSSYAVPITVVAFLLLPLVFALFFGRVFCAGACPLGMIQDVVLLKPLRLPRFLSVSLGVLPFLYLGLAVVFTVTRTTFLICRFDPFVAFFRLNGAFSMLIAGFVILALATVVGRPYCRFACPYGAVLGLLSRLAWKHVTVTPSDCIVCGLCENACPFDAIAKPSIMEPLAPAPRRPQLRLTILASLFILLPILGATLGFFAGPGLARLNDTVSLARTVSLEDAGAKDVSTVESDAFRDSGVLVSDLYSQARDIQHTFTIATAILGGFLGLVFAFLFFDHSRIAPRREYTIRNSECVSCARCLKACPREIARLKKLRAPKPSEARS